MRGQTPKKSMAKNCALVPLLILLIINFSQIKTQDVEDVDILNKLSDSQVGADLEDNTPISGGDFDLNYDNKDDVDVVNNEDKNVDAKTLTFDVRNGKYLEPDDLNYDPMTSNKAPNITDEKRSVLDPYVITDARLKEVRNNFMYPFFNRGGNIDDEGDYQKAVQSSSTQIHKNLNFQLPFFGFRFNYTRISINGFLEFSDPPAAYATYPLSFPVKEWPNKNDPSFIGIFFSKCRVGSLKPEDIDRREPGLYFRLERDLRIRGDRLGVELTERLKWDIREGVIGAETFDPKHAIIVTWKNVSFTGGNSNSIFTTNTFQVVLATDEVFTYAIFNYAQLDWSSHTEAGGDPTKGEGGTPAFVGFNAGNGTRSFEYRPYSQASVIRDLSGTGFANGFPGRHIFRIDENIMLGTCNKDLDGADLPLVIAPESGNMLGGTMVNITGPCFHPEDKITCKFDVAEPVIGVVVDKNRAICEQPMLNAEGYVDLEISVGYSDRLYKWRAKYFVETPGNAAQKIFFNDMSYNDKAPERIDIKWVKANLTTNENANIRITLWGYRETTARPQFLYITEIASKVQNTGTYTIIPGNFRNNDDHFLTDLKFGFLQITINDTIQVAHSTSTVKITKKIWSRPMPLAWYFGFQWERMYGSKWPNHLCDQWLKDDRYLKNFAHELTQCPCTLDQALTDKGRFMPDFECDRDTMPLCYYQESAVHCVHTGAPTAEGAEQQCCYDKTGYLMLSYDQRGAGQPRRSHNLGVTPYVESTKRPTLSQWYHDMIPKFVCCAWQEESAVGCETFRFERRPTQDCVAYQPPGVAGVYGDPHFITFDDMHYTFNGKGEFVLLKTDSNSKVNLEIQGRFEQLDKNAYGEARATQLTSIVAKGNSSESSTIEVRLRPKEARWRYRLDVIADKRRIYFDRQPLKFQHFKGVTVYTPTYTLNQSEVILMFDTGAGVEVVENDGYMSVRVYLPWHFINKTMGLLGNWSFDMTDDFVLPDGSIVGMVTNLNDMSRVYTDFGLKWMVDDVATPYVSASLFHRDTSATASTYNNKSFIPEYRMDIMELIPDDKRSLREEAKQICTEENYECLYDYALTLNREAAHFTTVYKSALSKIKEKVNKREISCGVLETPRFGWKSNFYFTPGHKVNFECSQDFILVGDSRRECLPNGQWNLPEYGYTECLRQQEYSSQKAAITSGIILTVLIPIILLLCWFGYKAFLDYEKRGMESTLMRTKSRSTLSLNNNPRSRQVASPVYSDDTIKKSPLSDISGSTSSLTRQRRSYDKSYRTNEPLVNRPNSEFEDKPFDLDVDENESLRSVFKTPSPPIYTTIDNRRGVVDRGDSILDDSASTSGVETRRRAPEVPSIYSNIEETPRLNSGSTVVSDV